MKSTKQLLVLLICFLLTFSISSCYHYRVTAYKPDPGTEYQRKRVNTFFWGLVQSKDVRPENCEQSNALDEVHIINNFGFSLLNVITLGIWCPITVEWKCSKPCQTVGDL